MIPQASIPLDQLPDRDLVELGLRQGGEPAFRSLFHRHNHALLKFVVRRLGGDMAQAEDIVQDTWLRAIKTAHRFRWESSFRSWLIGIALNRIRDLARRQKRRQLKRFHGWALSFKPDDIPGRLDLETAILQLPERARKVLLHHVDGFTHREIGDLLGIPEGTSKSDLHRARRVLRGWGEPRYVRHGAVCEAGL